MPSNSCCWIEAFAAGRGHRFCPHSRHASPHAFVHCIVRQPVGFLIVLAERVPNREPIHLRNQFFRAAVQVLQHRILHLVDALDLPHQQLRVADQLQGLGPMLNRVFEGGDQPLIFREVVGLVAEVFAERGDLPSGFILDDDSISGRAGIAARPAITVGDQVMLGGILASLEKMFGCAAGEIEGMSEFITDGPAYRPAARRVASRGGSFAAKIRSCASFRL